MEDIKNKNICKVPFFAIEIDINGEVTVCCPAKNAFSIGNVYTTPFDEIWYSDRAKLLRREILSCNYSKCNLHICNPSDNIEQDKLGLMENQEIDYIENPPYPKYVKFCHDSHCNIKCITCRDCYKTNSKEREEFLNSHIEKTFLPILKNCEIVSLNGGGEVFASPHCKKLVKTIAEVYPDIKFDLHTNGVLCSKSVCDNLDITDKIVSVDVSMHAAEERTYNKILKGSNYKIVLKNIKWLSELKKKGTLRRLDLYFVVQKMNYKEMPKFIKLADEIGADVYFWEYRNWGTKLGKKYKKIAVYEKYHKDYNKFAKLLQSEIFKQQNVHLNNFLLSVKPITESVSLRERFNNLISDMKKFKRIYDLTKY